MTQDEIIEMARRAGVDMSLGEHWSFFIEELEAFAKLVAEKAVRESSAEYRLGWNDGQIAEREACAKDAEWCIQNFIEQHIPARIRARGGE